MNNHMKAVQDAVDKSKTDHKASGSAHTPTLTNHATKAGLVALINNFLECPVGAAKDVMIEFRDNHVDDFLDHVAK